MARPTKYTDIKAAKIIEGLKAGMTRTAAAGLVNVTDETLSNWEKRYSRFLEQTRLAEQEAEARYTSVIAKAAFGHDVVTRRETTKPIILKFTDAQGNKQERIEKVIEVTVETHQESDWRAAMEWLRRRRHLGWGDKEKLEVTGEEGKPLILKVVYEDKLNT